MLKSWFPGALLLTAVIVSGPAFAGCGETLFVSDYVVDQVRVFDGCTGDFVRDLDNAGRIDGPQAIRIGPDGLLYVVSEENARVLRYNPDTLDFVDIFVQDNPDTGANELNGLRRPTGLDFGPDGDLFVGGFQSNSVHRFSGSDGSFVAVFADNGDGLSGPDGGLSFGPDGNLYVPNFNSDSISVFDPSGVLVTEITAPGTINEPRVLVFSADESRLLVSSYANGRVVSVPLDNPDAAEILGSGFASLSGMALLRGELLITGDRLPQIDRRDPDSGDSLGTLVPRGTGGLDRPTFILAYSKEEAQAQIINEQFWMVGLGAVTGATLRIDSLKATRGSAFGDNFDPDAVVRDDWGWFELELTGCASGEIRYGARSPDFAAFSEGSYEVIRIAPNGAQRDCETLGFTDSIDPAWMAGSWFGGAARNGEGFFVDALEDGQVFLSWFTYGAKP